MGLKTIVATVAVLGALASLAQAAEAGRHDLDLHRGSTESAPPAADDHDRGPVVRLLHPLAAGWAKWSRQAGDGLVLPVASGPAPTRKPATATVRGSVHPLVAAGLASPGFGYDLFFPGQHLGRNLPELNRQSLPASLPGSPQRWAVFSAWPAGAAPGAANAAKPVRGSEPDHPAELLLAVRAGF